jgi:hypothetical protein
MKDNRLTNILLIILIVLVAACFFRPNIDGAQTAQATTSIQDQQNLTDGEKAISKAQKDIAKANTDIAKANADIAKAIEGHGDKMLEAAQIVATAIEKTIKK